MKKLIFFLFLGLQLSAQEFSVKKGMVVDGIKVADTLAETYALYLPTNYENERTWPVLFVFDGKGRGKASAQCLKSTAEQQGYIVISSNDVDPQQDLQKNVLVAARLMQEATRIFPVDMKQVATVGSMAGAKAASSIPLIFNDILGVIAVGDHWVNFNLVDRKKDFAFIGIVGDEQFSASGMKVTANALSRLKFPSVVYTYDGSEEWPSSEILNSAVGSLTINAMRQGLRPPNRQLLEMLYQQDLAQVNKLMSLNQLMNADNLLEIMEEKYSGYMDTSEIEEKQDQLSRSRNFDQQKKEQRDILEKEARLMEDFSYYLEEDIRTANFENLGWWNYQKNQLDSLSQKSTAEAKMATRLKGFIKEYVSATRAELEEEKAPLENRLLANMIQTIFDPQAYDAYRNIISLSAMDNDFQTAYFYLEEMLKHGYRDMDALYDIEGTLGLKFSEEYNRIIKRFFGTSRYYESVKTKE